MKKENGSMVYDCMLDSKPAPFVTVFNSILRYDGVRGVVYSPQEMEAFGLDTVYTEYEDVGKVDFSKGEVEAIDDIVFGKMFPAVSEMGMRAENQGKDPGGFYVVGALQSMRNGNMRLTICMMCFNGVLEKNLYLLTSLDKGDRGISFENFVRVRKGGQGNHIGVQNMLQLMN